MVMIEYKDELQAAWTSKTGKWAQTDKIFEEILNSSIPDEDDIPYSIIFKTGGMDKLILDEAKKMLGKDLKVVVFAPSDAPEEIAGVDH